MALSHWCICPKRWHWPYFTCSVQFSHSVMSASLWPHEPQHARPPCPSPTPGVYSNSCPSSRRCHPAVSSSVIPFSSCPQSLPNPSIRVFPNESTLYTRWAKYWSFSFSISPSSEHPGLISFRMDWLDLLAVQGTNCHVERNRNQAVLIPVYCPVRRELPGIGLQKFRGNGK